VSRNHSERDEDGRIGWSASDSARWRKIFRAQLLEGPLPCVNPRKCGGALVYADQLWDVAHVGNALAERDRSPEALGVAHRSCNRSDGGREGAKMTNARRKPKDERKLAW
jgi:hypothetical protein